MQTISLKREHPNKKSRLIGRGETRGKTSGRGGKGQTARAGNKRRPQMRDIIKKIPKLRGYRFHGVPDNYTIVNVGRLNTLNSGLTITPKILFENQIIKKSSGRLPKVKILGNGELTVKLNFSDCKISKTAKLKIEKAGGKIIDSK
jgi:large subunit ribosomal protein L15